MMTMAVGMRALPVGLVLSVLSALLVGGTVEALDGLASAGLASAGLTNAELAVKIADIELQIAQKRREVESVRFDVQMSKAGWQAEEQRRRVLENVLKADADSGNMLGAQILDERWRKEQVNKRVQEEQKEIQGVEKEIEELKVEAEDPKLARLVQRGVERVGEIIVGKGENGEGSLKAEGGEIINVGETAGAFVDTFGQAAVEFESVVEKSGVPPVVAFWICFVCFAVPLVALRVVLRRASGVLHFKQILLIGYLFNAVLFLLGVLALAGVGVDPIAGLGAYCRTRRLHAAMVSALVVFAGLSLGRSFLEGMLGTKPGKERNLYAIQAAVYWVMVLHFFRASVPVMRRSGVSGVTLSEGNALHYLLYVLVNIGLAVSLTQFSSGKSGIVPEILNLLRGSPSAPHDKLPSSNLPSSLEVDSAGEDDKTS